MSIPLNTVIKTSDERLIRVLWTHPDSAGVWAIDIYDKNAQFELWNRQELVDQLFSDFTIVPDPYEIERIPSDLIPEKHRRLRDRVMEKIGDIVQCRPDVFEVRSRAALIKSVISRCGGTYLTINRHVRRFFQRGAVPQAMAPDYRNCGNRGRPKSAGPKKRGRPRKKNPGPGININKQVLDWMRVSWKLVLRDSNTPVSSGYNWLLETCFGEYVRVVESVRGKARVEILDHGQIPSIDQYYDWWGKDISYEQRLRRRIGPNYFDLNYRNLVGSSLDGVRGPGSRYEIDATIGDVYLVSSFDRTKVIGRPTIYLVKDVFSRMIVGMYVGLEAPCWPAAALALLNCLEDKVAYAAQFGVQLDAEEWPVADWPAYLLGDRGEMLSSMTDMLAGDLGLEVENTVANTPIQKGSIEVQFRILHTTIRSELHGYVDPDYKPRCGKNYVLDAKLTLNDFTALVIQAIKKANFSEKRGYKTNPEAIADGIPYVPIDLWNWGKQTHRSEGRALDPQQVMKYLLPREQVKIEETGIQFQPGVVYKNAEMESKAWYFKAQAKGHKLQAAYHLGDMTQIYVLDPEDPTRWYTCPLSAHSDHYAGKTYIEMLALRDAENTLKHKAERDALPRKIEVEIESRRIKKAATRATKNEHYKTMSKSHMTKNMAQDRQQERESAERQRAEHLIGEERPSRRQATTGVVVTDENAIEARFRKYRDERTG